MSYIETFKTILKNNLTRSSEQAISIFVARMDGVILFSNEKPPLDKNKESIGALVAGLWQAAELSNQFLESAQEDTRLSFDTSDGGIYVLPISISNEKHLYGAMYSGQINPGMIKNLIRKLRDKSELELRNEVSTLKSEYLFNNVTDEEVDNLFSFVGN
ncbi:hypothetical protein OAT67_00640 [Bacteriovoracaceae bacterium]|nr:hypothetical protein [Bacteriovoracaceae bacterium]